MAPNWRASGWQRLSRGVLGALFAQDCFLCGQPAGAELLCTPCAAELPRTEAPVCPTCAIPLTTPGICGDCLKHPPLFDATIAACLYRFPLDRLVPALKFGHQLSLAPAMARWLGDAVQAAAAEPVDRVVPVPLHPARLRERGFNQSAEIGRRVARRLGVAFDVSACCRVLDTQAQMTLERDERRRNVRGAFLCERDVSGLRVAVVDDVLTTGATLDALARALKDRGAVHVENWVVARTP